MPVTVKICSVVLHAVRAQSRSSAAASGASIDRPSSLAMTTTDGQFKPVPGAQLKQFPTIMQTVIQHCLYISCLFIYYSSLLCCMCSNEITCSWCNTEEGYTHLYHQSESLLYINF